MNKTSSASDYKFEEGYEPHTNKLLKPVVLHYVKQVKAMKVLDIGCGGGSMSRDIAALGPTVVGIEPSESGVESARKRCPSGKFYCTGIYDNPDEVAETDFDLAVSTEVIEHVFYPRELPRYAYKKLKPGGLLVISTPYHGWLKNVAISVLGKWDSHHTLFWDGGHIKFWSRATLSKLLEEEGFDVVGFHGCGRAPYLWESMFVIGRKR